MRFRLDHDVSAAGTGLQGEYWASYAELAAKFGEAKYSNYRVTTIWKFVSDRTGEVVSLYEYKETADYGDCDTTVEEFRAMSTYGWHVGAKDEETFRHFTHWLRLELMMGKKVQVVSSLEQRDYTVEGHQQRRPGATGVVIGHSDSHGLCWQVRHDDGTVGFYDSDELEDEKPPPTLTRYDRMLEGGL